MSGAGRPDAATYASRVLAARRWLEGRGDGPIDRLNEHNISTTLVVTLKKGLNDGEIGEIIDFALKQRCVRGVTFQPVQSAGRVENFNPATDRLTLGEVRQQILAQSSVFKPRDLIPVPCHPDCLAMAYALKLGDCVTPLTGMIDPQLLLHGGQAFEENYSAPQGGGLRTTAIRCELERGGEVVEASVEIPPPELEVRFVGERRDIAKRVDSEIRAKRAVKLGRIPEIAGSRR
jgi:hypothetical protein